PIEKRFAEIAEHVSKDALILTSSASGRLADVAHGLPQPERFLGMHVFGPVGLFPVVEVRHAPTAHYAVNTVREWASLLGWTAIPVGDRPGLLLNRIWAPAWNELVLLLREGARIERLDPALAHFGLGRSLLEFLDQMGLDHVARVMDALHDELGE